mmetsp:Transcript_67616/g.213961  ORF Transcript_67616/g.213961 Transcript_67616/m.213961 type:complete len:204 (-) Transcript_67616:17-628(-)
MVSRADRAQSEAQIVPTMEPKYAAEKGSRSGEVRCTAKLPKPRSAAKLPRMQRDPVVNIPANLCGASTISGKEAVEMLMRSRPRRSSTAKLIHCWRPMVAACMAVPSPMAPPAFSATLCSPPCARPRRRCVSSSHAGPWSSARPSQEPSIASGLPERPTAGASMGSSALHFAACSLQLAAPPRFGRPAPGMAQRAPANTVYPT